MSVQVCGEIPNLLVQVVNTGLAGSDLNSSGTGRTQK